MKKLYAFFSIILVIQINTVLAFAQGKDFGNNIKDWVLEQAFALAIVAIVVVMIPLILRKAWSALAVTLVCGALALFFVANPETLMDIGQFLVDLATGK